MAVIVSADDDADVRELIGIILGRAGHTVVTVTDGDEALARARAERPDLVLLDGLMPPGADGFSTTARFAADPALADIPVVLVTGSTSPGRVLQKAPHAVAAVPKPFRREDLLFCIRRVLGQPAEPDEPANARVLFRAQPHPSA